MSVRNLGMEASETSMVRWRWWRWWRWWEIKRAREEKVQSGKGGGHEHFKCDCLPQNLRRKRTQDLCQSGCQWWHSVGGQCWGGWRVRVRTLFMCPCCLHCHQRGQCSCCSEQWLCGRRDQSGNSAAGLVKVIQQNSYRHWVMLSLEHTLGWRLLETC